MQEDAQLGVTKILAFGKVLLSGNVPLRHGREGDQGQSNGG